MRMPHLKCATTTYAWPKNITARRLDRPPAATKRHPNTLKSKDCLLASHSFVNSRPRQCQHSGAWAETAPPPEDDGNARTRYVCPGFTYKSERGRFSGVLVSFSMN